MHLAIFLDAVAVAGDKSLLLDARNHLDRILTGSDVFLARFAAAVEQFGETSTGGPGSASGATRRRSI
jgi:CBS domain-containing protein